MRYFVYAFLLAFSLASCTNSGNAKRIIADSSGNINNLQVVITNQLWNGEVGEKIREIFAAPVDGLPQEEPLYSISQIPPAAFSGFARQNRIFLSVSKEDSSGVKYATNPYAKPQLGVFVTGKTNQEIIAAVTEEAKKITEAFYKTEIKEKQRRIKKSLLKVDPLKNNFGISMKIPTAYRFAKEDKDFTWIRKDTRTGSVNIIVYEVGLDALNDTSAVIQNIIKIRDSISGAKVTVPEGGRFITEEAYAPYLFETTIDNKFTYLTKGTFEVKNLFMAGPFCNYAIRDEANNRYLIVEGFTFAPSIDKRDYQFELEAIINSVTF
ncbi:MAG: DUF4837 family protein [Gilvibacter sp.]